MKLKKDILIINLIKLILKEIVKNNLILIELSCLYFVIIFKKLYTF
jgi:hypothetical protein